MSLERPFAAVPRPDAERVAAIRMNLNPHDEAAFAAFGEEARSALGDASAAVAEDQGGRTAAAAALALEDLGAEIRALDPRRLVPRRGLAGLFDSRGKRLKAMRRAFQTTQRRLEQTLAGLSEQANALRNGARALEPAHEALRAPIVELGAWIEAGRARLADVAGEAPEGETPPRARLEARLATLSAARMAALAHLPLGRTLQNADAVAADRLEAVTAALQGWRDQWRTALGLEGRRPRKVRPDSAPLEAATQEVDGILSGARALLEDGRARRERAQARLRALKTELGL